MNQRAKFECLRCINTWEDNSGPTYCKVCGSLYVNWLNYEKWTDRRKYLLVIPGQSEYNTVK